MAESNSIERAAPTGARLCVLRGAIDRRSGEAVTGVFEWEGKCWRTARILDLVKRLPASISDAGLRAEYRAAVKAARP